ncbi:MAG: hypothetical protein JWN23_2515 [Rhodocyclales bacterium]|nr:hypothetical protein [Rhodocyclales bacterium]
MSVMRITNFEAKDDMAERLGTLLTSVIPLIEQSPGCESCRLLRSQDNDKSFVMIEAWSSIAEHQASVKQIPPEKIIAAMTLLAAPPSGIYYSLQA